MKTLADGEQQAELVRRLRLVGESDRPLWGVMSAGEMVCHLRGAFRGAMDEWAVVAKIDLGLPPRVLKFGALRVPRPWPKNVRTVDELRCGAPLMQVGVFARDRDEAIEELERFCQPGQRRRAEHPMMGLMSEWDWMRWGYLHTDHHLRQFGR
jgi:hypothetical protein